MELCGCKRIARCITDRPSDSKGASYNSSHLADSSALANNLTLTSFHLQPPPTHPMASRATKPSLRDLLIAVKGDVEGDWKNLGRLLGIDENKLKSIQMDNFGDTSNSLGDMLGQWTTGKAKTGNLPRDWHTFVQALYQAGHEELAEGLAVQHGVLLRH